MRRQEQVQAEYDKAEDDVFAKVAMKEKLEKEVCGGQGPGRAGWREMGGVKRCGRGGKKWEGWREVGGVGRGGEEEGSKLGLFDRMDEN